MFMHVARNPGTKHPKSKNLVPALGPCLCSCLSQGMWLKGLGFELCPDVAWARTDRPNSKWRLMAISWLLRMYMVQV
jgi:hypothetical protein